MKRLAAGLWPLLCAGILGYTFVELPATDANWPEYNGDASRNHYSALRQITAENVGQLEPVWTYASGGADTVSHRTQMQCNPLIIDGVLYGVSAGTQAFALDAATGREHWKTQFKENGSGTTSRGMAYWTDGSRKRLFFGIGPWYYSLDAATGQPDPAFGQNGRINLKEGIERPGADEYVVANTPGVVFGNLVIVGARLSESETALLGDIRAYDVRTGKRIWAFHTIPRSGEFGYDTWPEEAYKKIGGANAWAGMAIDRQRGILYAPTGSAAYDFYGGNRTGANLFANCLLALDARTGKRLWHFQTVHHDIWDRDLPAPPNLVTVTHKGPDGRPRRVDAVAQITKQGFVFLFDRVTGKPLFPIEEKPFRTDGVPGEVPYPTQPIPTLPVPFARQTFEQNDFNTFVADRDSLTGVMRKARTGGHYIPVGADMTIFFPGTDGGGQWGGAAADPQGIMYIPSKEIPVYSSLVRREEKPVGNQVTGAQLYTRNCSACHGTDRRGNHDGSYPSLVNIEKRLKPAQVSDLIRKGQGMMPAFAQLTEPEHKAILDFLYQTENANRAVASGEKRAIPYNHTGYNRWYDRNGYPVSQPPWGTLTALDLNTGERRWQVPLGEYPELTAKGIPPTGTDNYGGPLVTASNLLFIAATRDERIRAFDTKTGRLLWQAPLPAAGYASPSTYSVNGRQYIVIACGGGKLKTKSGDKYVAFAIKN